MNSFEGYIGIRMWDDQLVNDLILTLLLLLLVVFAIVFRTNYRMFGKMIRDTFFIRERMSIFEEVGGNEFVFRRFMTFQTLFLASLSLFAIWRVGRPAANLDLKSGLLLLCFIFVFSVLYYFIKQVLYAITGYIFTEPDKYKFWKTNYNAITGFWGTLLYIPVFWLIYIGVYVRIPILLFVVFYILYRSLLVYKTIRIFHIKDGGFLYIILYLCGQEILPLMFLYEAMIYLYNFIEKSAIWH
ncbi:hypothetical protein M2459_001743 [Parabacteroides sp. PF5-5]|uniref:DUF4271 domain-containing protein n=1 Tax=unclassified Parabacteroides TaxID=2649774 RepID=UPI002473B04B|nr:MULTISPECIES: DUF4271 domain-containing protein [unclassified Parabacteroides]MDH6305006.1 hypothetical protein [Parabacteroides sp. PH5-39]MDH6315909.1 hypothetical protein [Parabacteroides sp. PF5-13]MDH6319566.1 hypothetical protein [Parabacteroides sp. PH5-13]MDH6323297.1 hypothetical protein [Parabacteroides sp. PH5-8]MDH6327195.1 hypothetical protein [Parabacteroides sp. PH5-41]